MTLYVVGDVDVGDVMQTAEQLFGAEPADATGACVRACVRAQRVWSAHVLTPHGADPEQPNLRDRERVRHTFGAAPV
ncbi:MAG: hypothetical protein ACK4NM_18695, partial [Hydrogenophaga sp.]